MRGNLVKFLIKYGKADIDDMKKKYPHERFDEIIAGMKKEGIVEQKKNSLQLVN